MGAAIKSEVRKLMTTRMWWGMGIAVFVVAALFAFIIGATSSSDPTPEAAAAGQPAFSAQEIAVNTYTGGSSFGYVLLLVIGILMIGAEYRHKTITGSLLAVPHRGQLILAKVIALLAFGVMYGVIFVIGSVAAGATTLSVRGLELFPEPGGIGKSLALLLLVLGLWALIGLGLGVLIPNQVAAIMVGVGLALLVEPIASAIIATQDWGEAVAKFFPSQATAAVLGQFGGGTEQLSWWAAALVLFAYAALFTGIGTLLTQRRDVS